MQPRHLITMPIFFSTGVAHGPAVFYVGVKADRGFAGGHPTSANRESRTRGRQLTWGAPTHMIPVSRTQFWARGTGVPRGRIGRVRTYGQEEAGSFQEAPGGTPAGIAAGHDSHCSGWARGRCGAGTGHRRSGCQLLQQGISVSSEQQRTTAPANGRWRPRPDPRRHLRPVHLLRRGDQPKAAGSRAVDAALHRMPGEAGERVAGTYRRVVLGAKSRPAEQPEDVGTAGPSTRTEVLG